MSATPVTLRLAPGLLQAVDEARGLESRAPFLVRMVELGLAASEEPQRGGLFSSPSNSIEATAPRGGLNAAGHLPTCKCPVCKAL